MDNPGGGGGGGGGGGAFSKHRSETPLQALCPASQSQTCFLSKTYPRDPWTCVVCMR